MTSFLAMRGLPLTYDECRAGFRHAAWGAGVPVEAHPISAPGPFGQQLSIDVVRLGASAPRRALVLLTGVHGVEGFAPSAAASRFVANFNADSVPADVGIVVVHGVNPWGMAHGRRQNENNVDLNRNWGRSTIEPEHNDAYDEIHLLACPDTPALPDATSMLAEAASLGEVHGTPWLRQAITGGQFRHRDGLHFGGDETEESNVILERVVDGLTDVDRILVVDLHTGHGAYGDTTFLSSSPPDSPEHEFLTGTFGSLGTLETSADVESAGPKPGLISRGIADRRGEVEGYATVVEVGTADDIEQLVATYHEQWVHRHGTIDDSAHRAARWRYRCCFTPDDGDWQRSAVAAFGSTIDAAVAAVADWT